jgi:heme exporter protein A
VQRRCPFNAVLELRSLACVRGGRNLFKDVSLNLSAGQLLRVTGMNGAGKTSLLRTLCGLMAPASGQVFWQGTDVHRMRDEFNRQLIYVGHAAALKDELSASENLIAAARLGGHAVAAATAKAALAQAGLSGRERLPTRNLSQGQRRRVALARLALKSSASLWILDEPFNALDTAATEWLLGLITAHLTDGGLVVLTSHQPVALPESAQQVVLAL